MGRLEAAVARFAAALDTLEERVESFSETSGPAASALAREVASLKAEREELLNRISALEDESQSLAGVTEAVEMRLDGAIAEIRAVLGRG
jgi:hypothetical protein